MKILLIGTDTLHRRYIINSLIDQGINFDTCIFQKKSCSPKFEVKPKWSRVEKLELTKKFKSKTRMDLKRVKKIIEINKLQSKDFKFKKEILEANFVIVSGADWIKGYFKIDIGNTQKENTYWCSALVSFVYVELGFLDKNIPWTLISPKELSSSSNELKFINCKLDNDTQIIY